MKCPYCLEEIIDGALVCRYCGKNQPLSGEAQNKRASKRKQIIIFSVVALVALIMFAASQSYEDQQQRLRAAALCNGSLTSDQLEAAAEQSAKESGQSVSETREAAIGLACPSMAK